MKCPSCSDGQMTGLEYPHDHPHHYDGVSEWVCGGCGLRVGRWSRDVLRGPTAYDSPERAERREK